MFVPYPYYRPIWLPNSRFTVPLATHQDLSGQVERIKQKLDTAEKKIDEYERLIGSLFAELRRDTVCHTCRENVIRATLQCADSESPPMPSGFTSQLIPTALTCSPECPRITVTLSNPVQTSTTSNVLAGAESSLSVASLRAVDQSPGISQGAHGYSPGPFSNSTPDGLAVSDNPQITVACFPTSTTPTVPLNADYDSSQPISRSISETTSDAGNRRRPDWSVEYNPDVKQSLSLHVAKTLNFTSVVFCTKFSRDGRFLAVGLGNGKTHLYNMKTGSKSVLARCSVYAETTEAPEIWAIRFSPDNKYLATGGDDGRIDIWQINRRRLCASFKHKRAVECVDFSPNSCFLVSASYDHSACMWRIRDGSRKTLYQHESRDFRSIAFSPNGRYIAAGNNDGYVRIWDARSSRVLAKWKIGDSRIVFLRSLVFTPDGKGIVVGGDTVQRWDLTWLRETRSGGHGMKNDGTDLMSQIYEFKGHKQSITAVSFSCDHRWLLSSSFDFNVWILDARSGAWVCALKAHTDYIHAADFSPTGYYIVSGGQDGLVRLWKYKYIA